MATITSTGLGSGLEVTNIVTGLREAEEKPQIDKIDREAKQATEQISALGQLNSRINTFNNTLKDLAFQSTFDTATATSGDTSVFTATTEVGAISGTHSVQVNQLAQSHSLMTPAFATVNESLGTGILTIKFGTTDYDPGVPSYSFALNAESETLTLNIDSTNNTLSTLRDAINANENNGVNASVVNDGTGFRLVLSSSDSGKEFSMQIFVDDDDTVDGDANGLSRLAFNDTAQHLTQALEAQDAELIVNGIPVSRSSNSVSSVIPGVTLDLLNSKPGSNIQLSIGQNTSEIEGKIRSFVNAYNDVQNFISEVTAFDSANGEKGVLLGDATVRGISSLLRQALNTSPEGLTGKVRSLADMGILTQRNGTVEIDEQKFAEGLLEIDNISDLFAESGRTIDSQIDYVSKSSLTKPGVYDIEVTQLATRGVLTGDAVLPADFAVTPFVIDADNDGFQITVDGIQSDAIALTHGSYNTEAALIAELQSQINSDSKLQGAGKSVTVSINADQLVVTSNAYGSSSAIGFFNVDANFHAELGIDQEVGITGVNTEGKIDGVEALGDGQFLLSESGNSTGIKIQVLGGALGDRGTVTFTEGLSQITQNAVTTMLDDVISSTDSDVGTSGSLIDSKTDSLYKRLQELDEREGDIKRRMDQYEARLFKQFNAMDLLVGQLNATSSYLTQTLENLPGYSREK